MALWLSVIGRSLSRHSRRQAQKTLDFPSFFSSGAGDGAGRGGGSGGTIRSSGGSFGRKQVNEEEKHFKQEQAEQIARFKKHLKMIHDERIAYHEKQMQRHMNSIKEHEKLKGSDKKPEIRDVHIKSHAESVKAHQEMLESLYKQKL